MKHLAHLACIFLIAISACKPDQILEDSDVVVGFSTDTLFFDTVFTTVGSITERIKIYNRYEQPILLSSVRLANGKSSNFKLNVDGVAGSDVQDVLIAAEDSIFVFVEVTVDPNGANTPMVIEELLEVEVNGNVQSAALVAWGQDAYFWPSYSFNFPMDSAALPTDKPHVFYGYSIIDSFSTLIIPAGAQIHFHNNSGLVVGHEARLNIRGTAEEKVVIQGDRLEDFFKDVAGQWGQIVFTQTSAFSDVNHAIIKNGGIGLSVGYTLDPSIEDRPSIRIRNSEILNMSYIGLIGIDAEITAYNTVVANCGDHTVALVLGGSYQFQHCTFANYWSSSPRSKPVLLLSNFSETSDGTVFKRDLNMKMENSILHGALDSEIQRVREKGVAFDYVFDRVIMKLDTEDISNEQRFSDILVNPVNPMFQDRQAADFSLTDLSPAIDEGKDLGILTDIQGKERDQAPDLGAYEYIP